MESGLCMHVVARDAVPLLPMSLARSFAERCGVDILRYLDDCQSLGLVQLWGKVCAGNELPARCNKEWFFTTFCGVSVEEYREKYTGVDETARIADYLNGAVKPYDVVSFMSNLPGCARFFNFERAGVTIKRTRHFFFLEAAAAAFFACAAFH